MELACILIITLGVNILHARFILLILNFYCPIYTRYNFTLQRSDKEVNYLVYILLFIIPFLLNLLLKSLQLAEMSKFVSEN
jgi:high-affinity K+ transport system ATPase subunit B